jgi:hypothetical protein
MEAHPNDVAAAGDYAVVTSNRGLHVIDMRDPTRPHEAGFLDTVHSDVQGSAYGVVVGSGLAYVLTTDGHWTEMRVVDVRDPARPNIVGEPASVGRRAQGLALGADAVLVAVPPDLDGGPGGLQVSPLSTALRGASNRRRLRDSQCQPHRDRSRSPAGQIRFTTSRRLAPRCWLYPRWTVFTGWT